MSAGNFGDLAEHYDELMLRVDYRAWVEYLELLFAFAGVRPRLLLDVCCGTGTMAAILAARGYDVEGIDLASKMIAVARKKVTPKLELRFHVGDATNFSLGMEFDAAFSFFDSLNYIADLDGFRKAVANVGRHLAPGGVFIFDLNTAYAFEAKLFDQVERSRRARLRYNWVGDYDPDTRMISVKMDFDSEGTTFHETHVQRAHSDDEVREALADGGFIEVDTFDAHTLAPPRAKSDRLHYLARRG